MMDDDYSTGGLGPIEGEKEAKTLIQNDSRKDSLSHKDRSLFGMEENYTLKEVILNFLFCRGLQIRKYRRGKVESPIFRLIYIIFVICVVIVQVFLRGWNLFIMVVESQKTNVGFWLFYIFFCILTVATLVMLIMPLVIHETRMLFLGVSLCCTSFTCCFGIAEIIILAFVVTSDTWVILLLTIIGDLCMICWFWIPSLYLVDILRQVITQPRRRRKRRRTLDDMYN